MKQKGDNLKRKEICDIGIFSVKRKKNAKLLSHVAMGNRLLVYAF